MSNDERDPMDVAYDRIETALEFAHVATRWCKVCARKIYILRRDSDQVLRDFTADGAEHGWLGCGEDIEGAQKLTQNAVRITARERAEIWANFRNRTP